MLDSPMLEKWLAAYGAAWQARDPDAAAALFAPDSIYLDTPYSEPFRGPDGVREYWAGVTADQREVDFESRALGVIGQTGVAEWSCRFKLAASDNRVELNGVFLLEFDASGLCTSLREWWHAR